jgi:drug/metabolite transporter (DMT)-like permease
VGCVRAPGNLHVRRLHALFFAALEHLDVTVASFSIYLIPIFGVLLSAVLLGERLGTLALTGSGIVLVATVLIMKYDTSY